MFLHGSYTFLLSNLTDVIFSFQFYMKHKSEVFRHHFVLEGSTNSSFGINHLLPPHPVDLQGAHKILSQLKDEKN